jgi:hypothetical protein
METVTAVVTKPASRPIAPDPDPFRFSIDAIHSEGAYTLLRMTYHGCTNYEGRKILLLRKTASEVMALKSLDPHFLDDGKNGLIARFVPTNEGWEMGKKFLQSIL